MYDITKSQYKSNLILHNWKEVYHEYRLFKLQKKHTQQ